MAIEKIKPGIPESLKIGDHNPLTSLYSALSAGIHADTDEECLNMATAIRTILTLLAERMATVRIEREGVQQALAAIQNHPSKPKGPAPASDVK